MFSPKKCVLLVVDVQGKLAALMDEREKTVKNIQALIKTAQILDIPILWTEQAPEKIGATIEEISSHLHYLKPIKKNSFSCCGEEKFLAALKALKRQQVIVVGIETHVCVYQTVVDLVRLKYEVQVVVDAVSSRTAENKHWGLERIKEVGGQLTCTEMMACELLQKAEGEKYKEILKLIK